MDKQAEAALKRAIGMLEATLKRQISLHRSMLELAAAKRESIISGDVGKLEETVKEEKKLVAAIEEEEKKRLAIMPMVKRGLGLAQDSDDKLADVIGRMEGPEQQELAAVREELRSLIEECRRKTRHNAELLKASLEHVDAFLRAVAEAASPNANYNNSGRKARNGPTIIDRNA